MQQFDHSDAIDLVFTTYNEYSLRPTEQGVFLLASALKALDESLSRAVAGRTSFDFPEYTALSGLYRHVRYLGIADTVLRIKSVRGLSIRSDLLNVCLMSRVDYHAALMGVGPSMHDPANRAFAACFKQWGSVVDINPCVFNCMVKVFETLRDLCHEGKGIAFQLYRDSYDHEEALGLTHSVDGVTAFDKLDEPKVAEVLGGLYEDATLQFRDSIGFSASSFDSTLLVESVKFVSQRSDQYAVPA